MTCGRSAPALLLCVLLSAVAAAAPDVQNTCWQAVLRCHDEPDCKLAYSQYEAACGGNLRGARKQCPSHCVSALIRLNHTRRGPPLETCDCGRDGDCARDKRAIEPCLPRRAPGDADAIGCSEARQRCEDDAHCHTSLTAYLSYCGQLFNGRKCSSRCRATITQMLRIPSGALLNRCACDGVERPFCEVVKENMSRLCSVGGGEHGADGAEPQVEADDADEDEDDENRGDREEDRPEPSSGGRRALASLPLVGLTLARILA